MDIVWYCFRTAQRTLRTDTARQRILRTDTARFQSVHSLLLLSFRVQEAVALSKLVQFFHEVLLVE